MEIVEHKTVYANSHEDLDIKVNELLRSGWQPFGGVSIAPKGSDTSDYYAKFLYVISMVKYE